MAVSSRLSLPFFGPPTQAVFERRPPLLPPNKTPHFTPWKRLLVDGHGCHGSAKLSTRNLHATVLVAVSPDPVFTHEFLKEPEAITLYMPTWDMDELEALRQLQGGKVPADELARLVAIFGRVPRAVLEKAAHWQAAQTEQDSAILSIDVDAILTAGGEVGPKGSHKILHVQVRAGGALLLGRGGPF